MHPHKEERNISVNWIKAAHDGCHAYCAFVIQMDNITEVRPNTDTDPAFAAAFEEAARSGVRILFLPCHVEPDSLKIITKNEVFV